MSFSFSGDSREFREQCLDLGIVDDEKRGAAKP
jgi:hypothetical protein